MVGYRLKVPLVRRLIVCESWKLKREGRYGQCWARVELENLVVDGARVRTMSGE